MQNSDIYLVIDKIVKSLKIPVVFINEDLDVLSVNKGFKMVFSNYNSSLTSNNNLKTILFDQKDIFNKLKTLHGNKVDNASILYKIGNVNFEISSNFIYFKEKEYCFFFFRHFTISETEENNRRKFISNVAHELRTPLAAATSYAELLAYKEDLTTDEIEEKAKFIYNELVRLGDLVGDLFDITRFDQGQITLDKKPFDILELVEDVENLYSLKHPGKAIKQEYSSVSCIVEADYNRLKQVFINIIDNAFIYTGSLIRVVVTIKKAKIRISFLDDGCGIDLEQKERLFDRFYRTDDARTRNKGGTGLGLSIVKEIIDLHGGNVYVQSKVNEGTEFIIEIPMVGVR